MNFDGVNEYIKVNNNTNIDFEGNEPFSLCAWCKLNAIGLTNIIFDKRDAGGAINEKVNFVCWIDSLNNLSFFIQNNSSNRLYVKNTTITFNTNNYYHVCVTYDGSRTPNGINMFVNNSSVAVTTVTNTLTLTSKSGGSLGLGAIRIDLGSSQMFFNGRLDEVSIWNKKLSTSENSEIYNNGKPGNIKKHSAYNNLVSWWRMGDNAVWNGTSWNIPDLKNTNNGTSFNMEFTDVQTIIP